MKYTYKFSNGDENEVEISPEIAAILNELDDTEKSNDRRETRRHVSMDGLSEKGVGIQDANQSLDSVLQRNDFYKHELWLEGMQKRVLKKHLTERQTEVFYLHKILKYNNSKIARQLNITEGAIRKLIEKAETKLYNIVIQEFETEDGFTFEDIDFEDISFLEDLLTV